MFHLIFLGAFFSVLAVIATTLAMASGRALRDRRAPKVEALRWAAAFHDLPECDRVCRHELTGEIPGRICKVSFDCRKCETHAKWMAEHPVADGDEMICGLRFPQDRMYHRGHSWAKTEADGTVTVGLDEVGRRLIGAPEAIEFPAAGSRVTTNGTAWRMTRNGATVRVLSPVDGEVLESGGIEEEWYLRIQPVQDAVTTHLLRGSEVKPWVGRELEKLQLLLGGDATGATLADGGILVEDAGQVCPEERWDTVLAAMFLEG